MLPRVYAIVNVDSRPDPELFAEQLFRAGATLIQLRNKTLPLDRFCEIAASVKRLRDRLDSEIPTALRRLLLINDSVEICRDINADGIHLGQTDMPARKARELLGKEKLIGISTHNREQALLAPHEALNYLAVGPMFDSPTKSGHAPLVALDLLREISFLVALPVVAIGGINLENAPGVFRSGARSVAVISLLERSEDITGTLRALEESAKEATNGCRVVN